MSGIRALILRRDFTIVKKRINSGASHVHYGKGSYLNMDGAILTTSDYNNPPVLIFQEGNAVPKGVIQPQQVQPQQVQPQNSLENVKWETWYIPMLRGLNRQHHGRGLFNIDFKKWFNLKTLPFWLIGLAVLAQLLTGG